MRLRSATGVFPAGCAPPPIRDGNLEVHWPEGNVLLAGAPHDPESLEPDYNAVVTIEPRGRLSATLVDPAVLPRTPSRHGPASAGTTLRARTASSTPAPGRS